MIKSILCVLLFFMAAQARAQSFEEFREHAHDVDTAAAALDKITRECNVDINKPLDKDCVNGNFKSVKDSLARYVDANPELKNLLGKLERKVSKCAMDFQCIVESADNLTDALKTQQAQIQEDLKKLGKSDPAALMVAYDREIKDLDKKIAKQKIDLSNAKSNLEQCKAASAKVSTSKEASPVTPNAGNLPVSPADPDQSKSGPKATK